MLYGTNSVGTKGWHAQPSGGSGAASSLVAGFDSIYGSGYTGSAIYLNLVGDQNTPGNDKYYGTNSGGSKGWYSLPSGGGVSGSGSNGQFTIWNGSSSITSVSQVTMSGNVLTLSDGISASWMQFTNYSTSSMTSLSVSSTTLVFNYELNTFCFRYGGVWYKFTGVAAV